MPGESNLKLFFVIIFLSAICLSWNLFHSALTRREAKYPHNANVDLEKSTLSSIHKESTRIESPNTTGISTDYKRQVEIQQAERQAVLKKACKRLGLERPIPEDDKKFNQLIQSTNLFYSDRHKLIACEIPKCGCTNFKKVLLTAEGIMNVSEPSQIKGSDAHGIGNEKLLLKRVSNVTEIRNRMANYFKFIMVREPFTRLLSAYRNKIEKPSDGQFAKVSKKIHQIVSHTTKASKKSATFKEFVRYISDPSHKKDPHWDFFHRLCSPCTIQYDFIAHLETVDDDIRYVMDEVNMTSIQFPQGYPQGKRTDDEKLAKYFQNFSTDVIKNLYDTYKVDYALFGYSLPLK